jgi:hypothetical protein
MSTIVLNSAAAESLRNCKERAILCDGAGQIVGYFEPSLPVYAEDEVPEFDEDELDKRVARWEGIPSDEVRRRLLERK